VIILGVSGVLGHDAAACLLRDGELVAFAEEERFTRQKHAMGSFPLISTAYCLAEAGLEPEDVDVVAASWDPDLDPSSGYLATWLPRFLAHPVWKKHRPEQVYVPHHLAHAASAAYFEGIQDAAVLVVDGNGEHSATTIGRLDGNGFKILEEYPITSSLGHFYSRAALYLGLGQHGEGKLMGLAGHGSAATDIEPVVVDENGYSMALEIDERLPTLDRLRRLASFWDAWFREKFGPPELPTWSWKPDEWQAGTRAPAVLDRADTGAAIQQKLVEAVVSLARKATELADNRRLILSGGVALNGSANATILDLGAADELVFFPACQDAGGALGAAAWAARMAGDCWRKRDAVPYLGPSITSSNVEPVLMRSGLSFTRLDDAASEAANRIAEGRVVAWCRGAMEAGPRALGNRSILAKVDDRDVAARVNRVKAREAWRPFGPSLCEEHVGEFFERGTASPYMLEFRNVRESSRQTLAGVTHADGTTRPQTVSSTSNPAFHRLISTVGELTGVPAVINTSFNVGSEPIVCSPLDAIRTFVTSDIDDLFLDNYVISK
jgi:carbamoyltransferase